MNDRHNLSKELSTQSAEVEAKKLSILLLFLSILSLILIIILYLFGELKLNPLDGYSSNAIRANWGTIFIVYNAIVFFSVVNIFNIGIYSTLLLMCNRIWSVQLFYYGLLCLSVVPLVNVALLLYSIAYDIGRVWYMMSELALLIFVVLLFSNVTTTIKTVATGKMKIVLALGVVVTVEFLLLVLSARLNNLALFLLFHLIPPAIILINLAKKPLLFPNDQS